MRKKANAAIARSFVSVTRAAFATILPSQIQKWLEQLRSRPAGIYAHESFFTGKPPDTLLTVSLSEPFENFHYKLVAGVVNLPA